MQTPMRAELEGTTADTTCPRGWLEVQFFNPGGWLKETQFCEVLKRTPLFEVRLKEYRFLQVLTERKLVFEV